MTGLPLVLVAIGTRPEAIKLSPVIRALREESWCDVQVISTGQHRQMLDQVLSVFGITPDHELAVMESAQSLSGLTSRILPEVDAVLTKLNPSLVLVQGDTTTAMTSALAAFYRRIPVGHIEAGLRTDNRYSPFPEEVNRRMVSVLATWHFAPTDRSRQSLLREGIAEADILVSGNPVIDALLYTLESTNPDPNFIPKMDISKRLLLITAHRRESFGAPMESLCLAIRRIVDEYPDVEVCFPVHLNPEVREPVGRILGAHPRIQLVEPMDYVTFTHMLQRSYLVLTDSGGIQEEAPALGKPVLVMREITERPEAIEAGSVMLVGTDEQRIVNEAGKLLNNSAYYQSMARPMTPYGDGRAAERIVSFLRTQIENGEHIVHPAHYAAGTPLPPGPSHDPELHRIKVP